MAARLRFAAIEVAPTNGQPSFACGLRRASCFAISYPTNPAKRVARGRMVVHLVEFERVSAVNSLLAGKIQGNYWNIGLIPVCTEQVVPTNQSLIMRCARSRGGSGTGGCRLLVARRHRTGAPNPRTTCRARAQKRRS